MSEQTETKRRRLTEAKKGENAGSMIFIMSMLPMFVGFGAFEIIDHFHVRELREAGDMTYMVWMLATVVFVVIGVYVCCLVYLYIFRHLPHMKESMMAIWEDENGEPIPEPPEPKPLAPEIREKTLRFGAYVVILLMSAVSLLVGIIATGLIQKWRDYMGGYEPVHEIGGMTATIMDIGELAIGIGALAVLFAILYKIVTSQWGAPMKTIMQDPKTQEDGYLPEEDSGVDNE